MTKDTLHAQTVDGSRRPLAFTSALRKPLVWSLLVLCVLLYASAHFMNGSDEPTVAGLLGHLLIEWTIALIGLLTACLAWFTWREQAQRSALVLVLFLPAVALLDAVHALDAFADTDPKLSDPAWILSRLWLSIGLALAVTSDHWRAFDRLRRPLTRFVLAVGALLVLLASLAVTGVAGTFPDQGPSSKILHLVPFVLLGLGASLSLAAPKSMARNHLSLLKASFVPQMLCQLSILAAAQPFDPSFMVAHGLKGIACVMILASLFLQRQEWPQELSEDHPQNARSLLASATQELERVDRELVQQELQRRLAETSLRMLEKAVETMSLGVTITDAEGKILYVNPAEAQMHGYSAEALLGKHSDLFAADKNTPHPDVQTKQPWTRERLNIDRQGRTFPARLVSDQVRSSDGQLIATVTICENISERKSIEAALERRDRILKAVGLAAERFLDEAPWEQSFGGVLESLGQATGVDRVYMNLEFESLSSEGITQSWAPPDGDLDETSGLHNLPPRARLFLRWRSRLQFGEILQGSVDALPSVEREVFESRGVRSVAAVPIFVGKTFYGYLSLEDSKAHRVWTRDEVEALKIAADLLGAAIHKRMTQQALTASEEQFRNLLENANDLIQSVNADGRFLFVNRSWKAALGFDDEQVQQLTLWDVVHPDHRERCQQVFSNLFEEAGGGRLEADFNTRDGRRITVEGSLSCRFHDGRPTAIRGIFRDISDRKAVDRMKQEFISVVSHELRTPLTSIIASLGLLKSGKLDHKPERALELLAVAHRNSNRLLQLINDLLDVQKLAANRLAFTIESLSLPSLLADVVQSIRSVADSHHVDIQLGDLPEKARIRGDRQRLHQVLNHLLSNAIKFSPPGQPVRLGAKIEGQTVRISVADQGQGIPEAFKSHLFEQFTQADSSHTRSHGGSGLGLSIVKGLVEGMGGQVAVDSEVGRGTSFYVTLPMV